MGFSKKINEARRLLMRTLTSGVGDSRRISKKSGTNGIQANRLLILRPNARLGNLLLITPLVQEVVDTFPDCKIDLFVKGGAAPVIFKNYENVDRIIQLPGKPFKNLSTYVLQWMKIRKQRYDLVINVDENSSSGRLSAKFSKSDFKIFGEADESNQSDPDLMHIAKKPVISFRKNLETPGLGNSQKAIPLLDLKLTSFEIDRGKEALSRLADPNKKTICIFTFATGDKCYCEDWWLGFYERLRLDYPNYNIIEILPMHNASQIGFAAPSFYSKDIREIASLIANTEIFIGADSGMMHLASASKTTVVGLFSVTNIEKYKPYGNNSIAIDTKIGNLSDWFEQIARVIDASRTDTDDTEAVG